MDSDEAAGIRRLLAKDEITDLVHRYSYYVDHRRYDEVVDLFTEECVVDFGPEYPTLRSRADLRRMFAHPEGAFAATSHHNANVLVTLAGPDHASVRTSVYAWHQRSDGTTPRLWGYYHDTVVRRAGRWRIAERQLRALGTDNWDAVMHSALGDEAP